ncbi:MAG: N-acetylmuramoyl-L-alanine amidase [Clostridium sp.]|nr:N-acetylmuramoyl-L-alanine amidase [Clostridium sp.]MCM1209104.1 N-acetylmuramoyl-L-alanine amidase [Ruminococcus sp.]
MAKRKVFINAGHGGSDPGAVGFIIEKDANLIMAKSCKEYLEKNNVEVFMHDKDLADRSQSSTEVINACESFKPDIAIDCHANSGKGKGFEIYKGISGMGDELAECIEAEVKKIGQNSRGIKTRKNSNGSDYYYFIRQTSCPAVICEAGFVDNKADADMLNEAGCKQFGEAYAKGILNYFAIKDSCTGATDKQDEKKEQAKLTDAAQHEFGAAVQKYPYLVKVTTDALHIRKEPSLAAAIMGMIKDRGVYTIMEQKAADGYTWGRLKSGAGWIALEHTKKL